MTKKPVRAALVLEDGAEFPGYSFGASRPATGEAVFCTGLTGYPQSLSDPSYAGQILIAAYPIQGNYGLPLRGGDLTMEMDEHGLPLHFESPACQVSAFVVADYTPEPSHWNSGATLDAWLAKSGVPGIYGCDTRALVKRLRERGTMRAKVIIEQRSRPYISFDEDGDNGVVASVSAPNVRLYEGEGAKKRRSKGKKPSIVLLDCGVKAALIRALLKHDIELVRVPYDYDISTIDYDGLFLSNGPGDPKACAAAIDTVARALRKKKPIFGVCLGAQLLALAAGGDTYKLPYGHRGQNQPCLEADSNRCYITSQNHGYAVRAESLGAKWETWFVNANDRTVEGIRHATLPFRAVQFHPEGCPGPADTSFLIDDFVADVMNG